MTDIGKADRKSLADLAGVVIAHRMQSGDGALRVVHIVQRDVGIFAGALGLPVAPFGFLFLNVGAVPEHNPAQVASFLGGVDTALEAIFV